MQILQNEDRHHTLSTAYDEIARHRLLSAAYDEIAKDRQLITVPTLNIHKEQRLPHKFPATNYL